MLSRSTIRRLIIVALVFLVVSIVAPKVNSYLDDKYDSARDKVNEKVDEAKNDAPRDKARKSSKSDPAEVEQYRKRLDAIPADTTPFTGKYDREGQFGEAWLDYDRNGCDTRNDILARDLTDVTGGTDDCTVYSGLLDDPYSGNEIRFVRGKGSSMKVQIDHIIPLGYAIERGADKWDQDTRVRFANDPNNLIASDGPLNGAKGARGPEEWMPPNSAYECAYSKQWIDVATAYDLELLAKDKKRLDEALSTC